MLQNILLHRINPARLAWMQSCCDFSKAHVLDVGCGVGILTKSLCPISQSVTALDQDLDCIKQAKQEAKEHNLKIHYHTERLESYRFKQQYEIICCMEILEHVMNPKYCMQQCYHWLKPNGSLFISSINRNFKSYFLTILMAETILKWIKPGTHHYGQYLKPSECIAWGEELGLKLQHITGLHYHPIQQKATLTPNTSVNYILHFQK